MLFHDINPQLMYIERLIKQDRLAEKSTNQELRKLGRRFEKLVNILDTNILRRRSQ